jgi:hypothetical protein
MTILGNICLALAALIYALPLQLLMHDVAHKKNDGGGVWGAIILLAPLGILLVIAMMLATARGGFDWLPIRRGPQYLLVFASGVAIAVLLFFSFMGKLEHPNHLPLAARPFLNWAVYVFPLLLMAFAFLTLNPSLGSKIPVLAYRVPIAIIGVASLLACAGMIAQWIAYNQQQQIARMERAVADGNERDRGILERVQSLNPTNDFPELLGFANRFENETIRKVAIQKARSHPQFDAELAKVLQNGWAEKGLVYLDACDVSEPERKALAEPVRAAILVLAADARDAIERTHTFYADQFDWNTRIILSMADKFQGAGVDYAPAIREFRAALDAPRGKDFNFNARRPLDAWLAKQQK